MDTDYETEEENNVFLSKKCTKCHKIQSMDHYYAYTKNMKTHYKAQCKQCISADYKCYIEKIKKLEKIVIEYKLCTTCDKTQKVSNFHRYHASRDGYSRMCKDCNKNVQLKWYNKNKDKLIQRKMKGRLAYKICKICKNCKSVSEFTKSFSCKDGYRNYCYDCRRATQIYQSK
jgi:hypothetical protein